MQLHTNYKQEPQQRLTGSTLQFGFGFLKAPFLLASSGFLFLGTLLRLRLASGQEIRIHELRENISSDVQQEHWC